MCNSPRPRNGHVDKVPRNRGGRDRNDCCYGPAESFAHSNDQKATGILALGAILKAPGDLVKTIDFFVIGAQKSGTTSIHRHLSRHPQIIVPPEKEAPFVTNDAKFAAGVKAYMAEHFKGDATGKLLGTVTPQYMMSPLAAERLFEVFPDCRIIAVLRDPIDRAYSHYSMAVRANGEIRTFDDVISDQLRSDRMISNRLYPDYWRSYVAFGEYGRILKEYFDRFMASQILVVYLHQLRDDPNGLMDRIFKFLGLPAIQLDNAYRAFNKGVPGLARSTIANLASSNLVRWSGRILPDPVKRRLRVWLVMNRARAPSGVDTNYRISAENRIGLQQHYWADGQVLADLTGDEPPWFESWAAQTRVPE